MTSLFNKFFSSELNKKIFNASLIIAAITFGVKLISVLKESVSAAFFGTGDVMDAFVMAFLLPSFAINVITGSFNAAVIPTYIQTLQEQGKLAAQQLFCSVMLMSIGLLVLLTIFFAGTIKFLMPFLALGFDAHKLQTTYLLFYIMLPVLVLTGISTLWGAFLNATERFSLPAITPVLTQVISILLLLLFAHSVGIYVLAFGITLGGVLEVTCLGLALKRRGFNLWPRWLGITPAVRQVLQQLAPLIAGALIMCSSTIIDQAMAATLGSGSNSAMGYALKIIALPLTLAATALGTAIIPYASKIVVQCDWISLRTVCRHYLKLIFICAIIFMIILAAIAHPLIKFLFQRGAFTAADTTLVTNVLLCFILQIPFYIGGILLARLHSSMRNSHILMWGSIINVVINIVFNYIFMHWLGVAGIALSTSIVYIISFSYLYLMFKKELECNIKQKDV
jgi:putative peptidoglycan lipid II flippase